MERQYAIAGPLQRDVTFHELVTLLRTNDSLEVYEKTQTGNLVPVNIKFVPDLMIGNEVADSVAYFDHGKVYALKNGKIVKQYNEQKPAYYVMAKYISSIPGFLPVDISNNTFTYESMSHDFRGSHKKYVYQLFNRVYELHRRGLCHLRLTPSSIGLVDDELMISDYESARASYSGRGDNGEYLYLRDIQACGKLVCFITTGTLDKTTSEYETLVRDCLGGKIPRITRALQDKLFSDMIDIELVSVRPSHVYSSLPMFEPSRDIMIKLSELLSRELEPSVSQSLAIDIMLQSGYYDLELAHGIILGTDVPERSVPDLDSVVEVFMDNDMITSVGHLVEAYNSVPESYRAMLSLYALPDLDRYHHAGLAHYFGAGLTGTEHDPDLDSVAPGDDIVIARRLKISQPVPSGLTRNELNNLS